LCRKREGKKKEKRLEKKKEGNPVRVLPFCPGPGGGKKRREATRKKNGKRGGGERKDVGSARCLQTV